MISETQAVLRVRRREFVVELIDQSRGGFSVALAQAPPFKAQQQALLRTSRGWSKVRIAYVEKSDGCFRLGLQFLADLDDPRQARLHIHRGRRFAPASGGADWVFFFGVLAICSLIAAAVMARALFPGWEIWSRLGQLVAGLPRLLRMGR